MLPVFANVRIFTKLRIKREWFIRRRWIIGLVVPVYTNELNIFVDLVFLSLLVYHRIDILGSEFFPIYPERLGSCSRWLWGIGKCPVVIKTVDPRWILRRGSHGKLEYFIRFPSRLPCYPSQPNRTLDSFMYVYLGIIASRSTSDGRV